MSLIVQKFGGTSVADTDSLRIVAERIIDCKKNGNDVVVVPSAMGSSTDELIQLANDLSENPTPRELDMLLSAGERITMSLLSMHLNSLGYSSFSLTGSQAGIITTSRHGQAEIEEITGERVKEGLGNGDIVIVAGFQGFNRDTKEITTLGRGGSDTSAVALAAALLLPWPRTSTGMISHKRACLCQCLRLWAVMVGVLALMLLGCWYRWGSCGERAVVGEH